MSTKKPEKFIPKLMTKSDEDRINILCYQKEITGNEVDIEKEVKAAVTIADTDIEIVPIWGPTLYHIKDLGFKPKETMDSQYRTYKNNVASLKVRPMTPTLIKGSLNRPKKGFFKEASKFVPDLISDFDFTEK